MSTKWEKIWFTIRLINVRLRFIMIMVVTAMIVGYWDTIMNYYDKWTRPAQAPDVVKGEEVEFYCPMHPNIVRAEMGDCPVCGMPLSKRKKGTQVALPPGILGRVQLSPYRVRLAGVATTPVTHELLWKEIRTVGIVEYDERRLSYITSRVPGRVDKLFVSFTGQPVAKGERVALIYSPELVSTQDELLLAVKAAQATSQSPIKNNPSDGTLVEAAKRRLRLWDITEEQIETIIKTGKSEKYMTVYSPAAGIVTEKKVLEGNYVEEGMKLYTTADLSVVWMQARVYEDEISWIKLGQAVEITSTAYPDQVFAGEVSFIAYVVDPKTRTVDVRVDIQNPDFKLKPGMYVHATIRIPAGKVEEVDEAQAKTLAASEGAKTMYQCPMHPEVTSDKPGKCSKCGMELENKTVQEKAAVVYWCPMHPEVTSDKPGKCEKCGGMELIAKPVVSRTATNVGYVCPIHPDKLADASGECKVCKSAMKRVKIEKVLAVPESAIIDTGTRKAAYIEREPGMYDMVEVKVGPRSGRFYPVLDGLQPGDRVVSAGAFLVDAENRLSPGAAATYFGASGAPTSDKDAAKP